MSKNNSPLFKQEEYKSLTGIQLTYLPNNNPYCLLAFTFLGGKLARQVEKINSSKANSIAPLIIAAYFEKKGIKYLLNDSSLTFYLEYQASDMDSILNMTSILKGFNLTSNELESLKAELINKSIQLEDDDLDKLKSMMFLSEEKDDLNKLISKVNLTDIKNYYSGFICVSKMRVLLIGKEDKTLILNELDQIKDTAHKPEVGIKAPYEDYSKVKKGLSENTSSSPFSSIYIGVKLPKREELYKQFGDVLFGMYSYLTYFALGDLSKFLKAADKKSLFFSLSENKLIQTGEDSYLYREFKTSEADKLLTYLKNNQKISVGVLDFNKVKKIIHMDNVYLPYNKKQAMDKFISAYENNLSLNELVTQEGKATFSLLNSLCKLIKEDNYSIYVKRGKK